MTRIRSWLLAGLLALAALPGSAVAQAVSPVSATATAVVAASAPGGLQSLPLQRDERTGASAGLSLVTQLALAAGLLVVLAGLYKLRQKRAQQGGAAPALAVGPAQRLAQGISVHTVTWGDEEILVACAAHGVTVLSRRARAAGSPVKGEGT